MRHADQILIVDDEETDVLLLQHAFKQVPHPCRLVVRQDGVEAIEYLSGPARADRPVLVLLDLKMPRVDGFQVLAWRAKQPALKEVPFVVLTSSTYDSDRNRACQLGAADFRVKPGSFHDLELLIGEFYRCWICPEGGNSRQHLAPRRA